MGLLGTFDLETSPVVDFKFCTIKEVEQFRRMDGIGSKVLSVDSIALIGNLDSAIYPERVAFVTWDGTGWKYKVHRIDNTLETLTDIAFSHNRKKFVTVARLSNEPYKFALRGETSSSAFDMSLITLPNYTHRNVVSTYGLYLQSSSNPHPIWHSNNADIRIVANAADTGTFTVAYECVDTFPTCIDLYQVALFRVDVSTFPWNWTMNITGMQMVFSPYETPDTFVDINYIPSDETIALLHKKNGGGNRSTLVQFPTWNNYGYIEALQTGPQRHGSMDVYNDKYLYMTGIDPSDNHLIHYLQKVGDKDYSCYITRPMAQSEPLLGDDWAIYQGIRDAKIIIKQNVPGDMSNIDEESVQFHVNCGAADDGDKLEIIIKNINER